MPKSIHSEILPCSLTITHEQEKENLYYTSIHEMTLLGGKWIGQRLKWASTESGNIRLEIFHIAPAAILYKASEMLAIENPLYNKYRISNISDYAWHNIIAFTLRNENNEFLAIASCFMPANSQNPAFIRQISISEEFKSANQDSLLRTIEGHAIKADKSAIETRTFEDLGTDFYLKQGYKLDPHKVNGMQFLYKKLTKQESPRRLRMPATVRLTSRPYF